MRGKEFQGYSDLRLLQVMLGWWSHWYVRRIEIVHQGKSRSKEGLPPFKLAQRRFTSREGKSEGLICIHSLACSIGILEEMGERTLGACLG